MTSIAPPDPLPACIIDSADIHSNVVQEPIGQYIKISSIADLPQAVVAPPAPQRDPFPEIGTQSLKRLLLPSILDTSETPWFPGMILYASREGTMPIRFLQTAIEIFAEAEEAGPDELLHLLEPFNMWLWWAKIEVKSWKEDALQAEKRTSWRRV